MLHNLSKCRSILNTAQLYLAVMFDNDLFISPRKEDCLSHPKGILISVPKYTVLRKNNDR